MPALPPRRLSGYNEHRGSRTGFSVIGALLFGLVFVAAGVGIVLVGTRTIAVDPGSVHAPYWVLSTCGLCFAIGGLMVWGMAARQHNDERRCREAARRYGGSPAMTDHAWDPRGYTPPRWKRATGAIGFSAFFTLFLSIFNWWAWGAPDAPWPVKGIVGLFDLVLIVVWSRAVIEAGRALKFGGSRLEFDHFPYRTSETLSLRWIPPRGVSRADTGAVTLRCLEEYYEERRSGKEKSRWLVHDELCAEAQSFETPQTFAPGRAVEFRFTPPPGARATKLAADRPVYWELEVKLSMPGFDFEERYLVPVYE